MATRLSLGSNERALMTTLRLGSYGSPSVLASVPVWGCQRQQVSDPRVPGSDFDIHARYCAFEENCSDSGIDKVSWRSPGSSTSRS